MTADGANNRTARAFRPKVVVLGDIVVDVVLAPDVNLESGTDIPGRVMLRQGGSGTTTARWLGRLGARVGLVGAVGRDAEARALLACVEQDGVVARVARIPGKRTGRIGVFVSPGGERSFVQDRAAVLHLAPEHLRPAWFAGAALVHIPTYSLIGQPLGAAGLRAAELGHAAGALVTVDLSSSRPLLMLGRERAIETIRRVGPDLIFTSAGEAVSLVDEEARLLDLAPVVVSKRGAAGVVVLSRANDGFEAQAHEVHPDEMTGAGDAFDAGFIYEWLCARHEGRPTEAGLRAAAAAGNRLAERHLLAPKKELHFD